MTINPPDTRKICEALEATKLTHKQAAALSDLFKDHDDGYREQFVTKAELESFGNKLLVKVAGGSIVTIGAIVGVASLFFNVGSHHDNVVAQLPTPNLTQPIASPPSQNLQSSQTTLSPDVTHFGVSKPRLDLPNLNPSAGGNVH